MAAGGALRLAALAAAIAFPGPAVTADATGTFALISDIHFDPFDPPGLAADLAGVDSADWPDLLAPYRDEPLATYGKDTNASLLASAVAALSAQAVDVDFAVVPGDLLSHGFEKAAADALGAAESSATVRRFAADATVFAAEEVARALPGKPVILALGNNDSACGDYEIEPGGDYLAATSETVRRLASPDLVAADFGETWAAGGYFAMRHPTRDGTLIVVLNDVLWSAKYRDACGSDGLEAAEAMFSWLSDRLSRQKLTGGRVWLVHHIPWGINPFATVHAKASSCPAAVTPLLADRFANRFYDVIREYAGIVDASLSGHIHHDSFRLIRDETGRAAAVDKVAPAISPIYGQNPAFQVWTYDRASGAPTDYSTIYLANLDAAPTPAAGDWRSEYTFTDAYGQPAYDPETVGAVFQGLSKPGDLQEAFRRLYPVSHGSLDAATLPAYVCAIGHVDAAAFDTCYCGGGAE